MTLVTYRKMRCQHDGIGCRYVVYELGAHRRAIQTLFLDRGEGLTMGNETVQALINAIGSLAEMSWSFMKELKKQGFTDKQALPLVQEFVHTMLLQSGGTTNE